MPDDIKVNDLPITPIVDDADTVVIVQNNATTKQTSLGDIGNHIIQDKSYSGLNTQNKHIIDAINEVVGFEIAGVLPAYSRTLVLQSPRITSTSTIRVFTENYTVAPMNVIASSGSVILAFEPRDTAIKVKVKVS